MASRSNSGVSLRSRFTSTDVPLDTCVNYTYDLVKRLIYSVPQAVETKKQILDAAETLFAAHGIEGVSLRSLTKEAGVNLASVHYHFGSKEAVARAVFTRRVRPINRERLDMLDAVERQAGEGPIAVEDVLTALFAPVIQLSQDPQFGRRFMHLCARFYSEPADYLRALFEQEFGSLIRRFEAAFARALPDLTSKELRCRMHFAIGVMVHTMLGPGPTCDGTGDTQDLSDTPETLDAMVRFVAAGMRAPEAAGATAVGSLASTGVNK